MTELERLNDRLKSVIENTCNKVGCSNCLFENSDGSCLATKLQDKIYDIQYKEVKNENSI